MSQYSNTQYVLPLSRTAVGFKNAKSIADDVAPLVRSDKQQGKYLIYGKDKFYREDNTTAPGATASRTSINQSEDSYYCREFVKESQIPKSLIATEDDMVALEIRSTEQVAELLLIQREFAARDALFGASNYDGSHTSTPGTAWDAGGDPFGDISSKRRQIARESVIDAYNLVITMGTKVYDDLVKHQDIIDRLKYNVSTYADAGGDVTTEMLARLFRVKKVVVGEMMYNSGSIGAADSMQYIWDPRYLSISAIPDRASNGPSDAVPSYMYTFWWDNYVPTLPIGISRYYEEQTRSWVIRGEMAWDIKIVGANAASYLFTNAVSA
jgi:hypothetical protein